jgi:VanZ family protein
MLNKIAPDKWKHFIVGILMGLFLQILGLLVFQAHYIVSIVLVFLLVAAISYGFELYSKYTGRGHYEVMDAVASIIGGVLGMAAVLAVKAIW